MILRRVTGVVAMLAIALWLGGLIVLGTLVAPVIFSQVSMPWSADAMTVIFQRFDGVAMSCAAALLGWSHPSRLWSLRPGMASSSPVGSWPS